jgi:prevent-host-death family protein
MAWSVSEARSKLSALIAGAQRSPQVIENRGEGVAVVLSVAEYERLKAASGTARRSPVADLVDLAERLRTDGDLTFELPKRAPGRRG